VKLLYLSVHETLEFDELSLFNELGVDFFSFGAYANPEGHPTLKRPGIEGAAYYPEYEQVYRDTARTDISKEFFDKFDVIMWMDGIGQPQAIIENWPRMKHKKVIWRSIGQSSEETERLLKHMHDEGLMIVRYSLNEQNIRDWMGQDAMIRFYKDPKEFYGWKGEAGEVINFTQNLKGRGSSCFYKTMMQVFAGYPGKIYGPTNESLGNLNGGSLPYDAMKGKLRDNRVYFYAGTQNAPYTLSFVEAWMTGIPIVTIDKGMAMAGRKVHDYFEVPELITHGESGFIAGSEEEARGYIKQLLDDYGLAEKISRNARRKAGELFGKSNIQEEWKKFFSKL